MKNRDYRLKLGPDIDPHLYSKLQQLCQRINNREAEVRRVKLSYNKRVEASDLVSSQLVSAQPISAQGYKASS